jgi:hypothetical protein
MFDTSGSFSSGFPSALTFTSPGLWLVGFSARALWSTPGSTTEGDISLIVTVRDSGGVFLDQYIFSDAASSTYVAPTQFGRPGFIMGSFPYRNTGSGNYVRIRATGGVITGATPANYQLAPANFWILKL